MEPVSCAACAGPVRRAAGFAANAGAGARALPGIVARSRRAVHSARVVYVSGGLAGNLDDAGFVSFCPLDSAGHDIRRRVFTREGLSLAGATAAALHRNLLSGVASWQCGWVVGADGRAPALLRAAVLRTGLHHALAPGKRYYGQTCRLEHLDRGAVTRAVSANHVDRSQTAR